MPFPDNGCLEGGIDPERSYSGAQGASSYLQTPFANEGIYFCIASVVEKALNGFHVKAGNFLNQFRGKTFSQGISGNFRKALL